MKKKEFSLAISRCKFEEIKKNKSGVISHCASQRWEQFLKVKRKKVRFFDTSYYDEIICIVMNAKRIRQLGEPTIRIEVKL